jgi:hypothetical protein
MWPPPVNNRAHHFPLSFIIHPELGLIDRFIFFNAFLHMSKLIITCAALGINSMALIWLVNIMPNLYFPPFYHYLLQNYSQNIIEITDKYKYLGIVFKNTGLLKYASENLAFNKARKAFYSLKSKITQSDKFSVKTWIKLYNSVIHMGQKSG